MWRKQSRSGTSFRHNQIAISEGDSIGVGSLYQAGLLRENKCGEDVVMTISPALLLLINAEYLAKFGDNFTMKK